MFEGDSEAPADRGRTWARPHFALRNRRQVFIHSPLAGAYRLIVEQDQTLIALIALILQKFPAHPEITTEARRLATALRSNDEIRV